MVSSKLRLKPTTAGGWGDTGWSFGSGPSLSSEPVIATTGAGTANAQDVRMAVQIDDLTNEAQWFFVTPVGFTDFKLRAVSFEGINLGVRPDLQ
jgi:hypothetical protein